MSGANPAVTTAAVEEFSELEKAFTEAKDNGNALVADGKYSAALKVYQEGIQAIQRLKAAATLKDGTKVSYEPVPLVLNEAFCLFQVSAELLDATFKREGRSIKIVASNAGDLFRPRGAAAELQSSLESCIHELTLLAQSYETLANPVSSGTGAAPSPSPSSSAVDTEKVIPKRYQSKELHAKVYFRRAQARMGLSALKYHELLLKPQNELQLGAAVQPFHLNVLAADDFRKCETISGEAKNTTAALHLQKLLFSYSRYVHKAISKTNSTLHGIGIIATEKIKAGTLLLVEAPEILVDGSVGDFEKRFITAIHKVLGWQKAKLGSSEHQLLLQYLTLHADPTMNNDDDAIHADSRATISPDLLCDVWLRNSMRLSNVEFSMRQRKLDPNSAEAHLNGGAGLYFDASRFNHSCAPNAVAYFDVGGLPRPIQKAASSGKAEINIVSLRDIEAGEEIFISYTTLISSAEKKRSHLKFPCRCRACAGESESKRTPADDLEALTCPVCSATALPTSETNQSRLGPDGKANSSNSDEQVYLCRLCGHRLPVIDYGATLQSALTNCSSKINAATSIEEQYQVRIDAAQMLVSILRNAKLLGPFHYLRAQTTLEMLSSVAGVPLNRFPIELQDQLAHYCRELVLLVQKLCPPNWPLLSGLCAHLAYLHARFTLRRPGNDGKQPDQTDLVAAVADGEAGDWICQALESHMILFPAIAGTIPDEDSGTPASTSSKDVEAINTFISRFQEELSECGIKCRDDLEKLF
jgi:hypothetical protein